MSRTTPRCYCHSLPQVSETSEPRANFLAFFVGHNRRLVRRFVIAGGARGNANRVRAQILSSEDLFQYASVHVGGDFYTKRVQNCWCVVDYPSSVDVCTAADFRAATQHYSVHPMIAGISVNRCDEFVRRKIERAQRLV